MHAKNLDIRSFAPAILLQLNVVILQEPLEPLARSCPPHSNEAEDEIRGAKHDSAFADHNFINFHLHIYATFQLKLLTPFWNRPNTSSGNSFAKCLYPAGLGCKQSPESYIGFN